MQVSGCLRANYTQPCGSFAKRPLASAQPHDCCLACVQSDGVPRVLIQSFSYTAAKKACTCTCRGVTSYQWQHGLQAQLTRQSNVSWLSSMYIRASECDVCVCDAGKFFWFLLFNYLTLIYFTFFGTSLLSVLTHTLTSSFFHVRSLHEARVVAINFKLQDVTELGLCCMCDIPSKIMLS